MGRKNRTDSSSENATWKSSWVCFQETRISRRLLQGLCNLEQCRRKCNQTFYGRQKNWLFSDTPKGAKASADIYSIVETAKANGLDVFKYFERNRQPDQWAKKWAEINLGSNPVFGSSQWITVSYCEILWMRSCHLTSASFSMIWWYVLWQLQSSGIFHLWVVCY